MHFSENVLFMSLFMNMNISAQCRGGFLIKVLTFKKKSFKGQPPQPTSLWVTNRPHTNVYVLVSAAYKCCFLWRPFPLHPASPVLWSAGLLGESSHSEVAG